MKGRAILDLYVLREFAIYFALTTLFFVGIFGIVDVFEKIDRFLDAQAGLAELARYFALNVPSVLVLILPMALLLAALLVLGQLGKFNELTAMNVAGRSFLRISAPMLGVALVASGVSFLLEEYVVPQANHARQDFMEQRISHLQLTPPSEKDNLIYLGAENRVYLIRTYLIPQRKMIEPTLQEFGRGRLLRRTDAREGTWDGRHWVLTDGVMRYFNDDHETAVRFARLTLGQVREKPEDFAAEDRNPGEMPLSELRRYIERLGQSGRPTDRYWVDYHLKISYPLINFIALLLSVGITAHLRRSSSALAFGLCAVASFAFYGLVATARALGQSSVVAPWLAAWVGHALFCGLAAVLIWKSPR